MSINKILILLIGISFTFSCQSNIKDLSSEEKIDKEYFGEEYVARNRAVKKQIQHLDDSLSSIRIEEYNNMLSSSDSNIETITIYKKVGFFNHLDNTKFILDKMRHNGTEWSIFAIDNNGKLNNEFHVNDRFVSYRSKDGNQKFDRYYQKTDGKILIDRDITFNAKKGSVTYPKLKVKPYVPDLEFGFEDSVFRTKPPIEYETLKEHKGAYMNIGFYKFKIKNYVQDNSSKSEYLELYDKESEITVYLKSENDRIIRLPENLKENLEASK